MWQILAAYWSIATLRSGPQRLPAVPVLLALTLLLHLLTGVLLGLYNLDIGRAAAAALAGTAITAGLVYFILVARQRTARYLQTLTGLAGAEVLLGLVALPLTAWFFAVPEAGQTLPALLSLLVLGWNVAVAGHVFRHALDLGRSSGFLVGIGYIFASLYLSEWLMPAVN